MLLQNSYGNRAANYSGFGSYKPAAVGMQPPTTYQMGTGNLRNEPAPLTHNRLPATTLLAPNTSAAREVDNQSCTDDGWMEEERITEERGGNDYTYCGVDLKPFLPAALALSTIVGAICMMLVQIPMLARFTWMPQGYLSAGFTLLYGITLGCMCYCAFADPGQLKKTRNLKNLGHDIEEGMPRRVHKSWQYPRPIRRYDHYCKWLQNVIGLLNHREFVIMLGGLMLISLVGIVLDIYLAVLIGYKGFIESEILVGSHLAYSIALLFINGPILRVHTGLISRNEMAQEWKKNEHYVANNTTLGDNIPVEELDDDEYNELFDKQAFVYDRTRNPFDNGCATNCWTFWCSPRWPSDAKGEF